MTFQHRAGVSSYTSAFAFAETCVFVKQLPGPFHCGHIAVAPLLPKLRGQYAEFLNNPSPAGLRILSSSTCVGLRYGRLDIPHTFSRQILRLLPYYNFSPFRPGRPSPGSDSVFVSVCLNLRRLRNFYRMCIDYAFRPRLSSRLTQGGRTYPWKPLIFGHYDSHAILATHSGILTSLQSTCASAHASPRRERSPTQSVDCLSFGYMLSPVESSAQHHSTSELLRTL